jgi:hypothetical protein
MSIFSPSKLSSERRFGFMFMVVLALLGVRGIIGHWRSITYGACFMASILFGLLALAIPRALGPLNRAWFYLGEGLGKIVSPIVLGIIFFGILTPISIVTRLFGRDELQLKRCAGNSYWTARASLGSAAETFKNQF